MRERSSDRKPGEGKKIQGKWLNLPNFFTFSRVLIAPVIIWLMIAEPELPYGLPYNIAAGILFFIAALTDKADGYFARKGNLVSKLGEVLDPIADKLLVIPLFVALWYAELIPLWAVIVVCGRDILVTLIRFFGVRRGVSFPASWSGKIKMFAQTLVLTIILFFPGQAHYLWVEILVYIMAAVTIYSGIIYLIRARSEVFGALDED